jgi:hypothetical protein
MNGGGDLLVFLSDATADRYADAVYWWDHETDELNLVADCFSELECEEKQAPFRPFMLRMNGWRD